MHAFSPTTQEAETDRWVSEFQASVPGKIGLHREILSREEQKPKYLKVSFLIHPTI